MIQSIMNNPSGSTDPNLQSTLGSYSGLGANGISGNGFQPTGVGDTPGSAGTDTSGMNLGQIGTGLTGILGSIFGNSANQDLSNTLQGMYAPAAQAALGPMQQLSSTLTNPSSYFNSPMYTSMANLYGNGVQAGKNAGGTTGNNIDYTQKMMGFGANSYDNYVNSLTNGTNALMSNARGMAPYGAFGDSLGNQSAMGEFGGIASGLGSLYSGLGGASGIGKILAF